MSKPVFLKCGHTASATTTDKDGNTIPCCGCHFGLNGDDGITPVDAPNLEGRKARCAYCWHEVVSDLELAFFEYRPQKEFDCYYCGCRGWD